MVKQFLHFANAFKYCFFSEFGNISFFRIRLSTLHGRELYFINIWINYFSLLLNFDLYFFSFWINNYRSFWLGLRFFNFINIDYFFWLDSSFFINLVNNCFGKSHFCRYSFWIIFISSNVFPFGFLIICANNLNYGIFSDSFYRYINSMF